MDEGEYFFCQFPNPWALRVSGMGCYTSKCEKVKITAPYSACLIKQETLIQKNNPVPPSKWDYSVTTAVTAMTLEHMNLLEKRSFPI